MKSISTKVKVAIYIGLITVGIAILFIAPDFSFMLFDRLINSHGGSYSDDERQLYLYENYDVLIFIGKAFIIYGFASLTCLEINRMKMNKL